MMDEAQSAAKMKLKAKLKRNNTVRVKQKKYGNKDRVPCCTMKSAELEERIAKWQASKLKSDGANPAEGTEGHDKDDDGARPEEGEEEPVDDDAELDVT